MTSYDWKKFTCRINIRASRKAVYEAWTSQQGLENWFLRQALFTPPDGNIRGKTQSIQTGDHYNWRWFGYEDSAEEKNVVLNVNGWDQLQFVFSGGSIVTVSIRQEEGETICELEQEMQMEDPDEQRYFYIECGKGWTFYLANLKSILEGGLDLRNKNPHIQRLINA